MAKLIGYSKTALVRARLQFFLRHAGTIGAATKADFKMEFKAIQDRKACQWDGGGLARPMGGPVRYRAAALLGVDG